MNMLTQEAKKRQQVVECAKRRRNKSYAAAKYGVSLSSVKRWYKRYDGTWQSLVEHSHRPHHHPRQHTNEEEENIRKVWEEYQRKGFDYVYDVLVRKYGYRRTDGGLYHAMKRMCLIGQEKRKKKGRKFQSCSPVLFPGEKIQIDVKVVPYECLRGDLRREGRRIYQWTAIDECTRWRYIFGYEEHTQANSVDFLNRLLEVFPFEIQTIQTDNGMEFTYKFVSDTEKSPFEKALEAEGISHKLIKPRTPWHNGKVERSHRNDQRYLYEWEQFKSMAEYQDKLAEHLKWSNHKTMRVLGRKSPNTKLAEFMWVL